MTRIKVKNMTGGSGAAVPNQFIIELGDDIYFQSYQTIIACKKCLVPGLIRYRYFLDRDAWENPTNTTSKYRNQFFGMTTREIKQAISEGRIILTKLNYN